MAAQRGYDPWLPNTVRRSTDITRKCTPECIMLRRPLVTWRRALARSYGQFGMGFWV